MGVIALALYAHGDLSHFYIPTWVKLAAGLAIAAGTYSGGWRIIRTLGQRVYQMDPPGGFAAQATAGAVLFASTKYGYPLSTTHVVSGAVMGSGATQAPLGRPLGRRRQHRGRVDPDDPGLGRGRGPLLPARAGDLLADAVRSRPREPGDLRPVRLGGTRTRRRSRPSSSSASARTRTRRSPRRDVKDLEHIGDQLVADLMRSISAQFITPFDPEDLVALAFAVDDVPDAIENASELLGLYNIQQPTPAVDRALRPARRGDDRARLPARPAEGAPRLGRRDPQDQGHRGPRRPRRPRRAGQPVQGRPDRPEDRHPLEGHLREPRGRRRRLRDRGAPRRQHPRQERLALPERNESRRSK